MFNVNLQMKLLYYDSETDVCSVFTQLSKKYYVFLLLELNTRITIFPPSNLKRLTHFSVSIIAGRVYTTRGQNQPVEKQ